MCACENWSLCRKRTVCAWSPRKLFDSFFLVFFGIECIYKDLGCCFSYWQVAEWRKRVGHVLIWKIISHFDITQNHTRSRAPPFIWLRECVPSNKKSDVSSFSSILFFDLKYKHYEQAVYFLIKREWEDYCWLHWPWAVWQKDWITWSALKRLTKNQK